MQNRPIFPCASAPEDFSICLHENGMPQSARDEMERLYQNIFSSAHAEDAGKPDTCAYIARGGGRATAILLFRRTNRAIRVLNSAIHIGAEDINAFVNHVFAHFPRACSVSFASIDANTAHCPFPRLQSRISEDYVVTLPSSVEAYKASLGKSTLNGLRSKQNRLRRDQPDFQFRVFEGKGIDERLLDDIFRLKERFAKNGNGLDDSEKTWLRGVVRSKGLVGVSTVNGEVCAGAVCTQVGSNFFLHTLAHDTAFDAYSLGMLNSFLTVCEGIRRGGQEFHFLWGPSAWKDRLGARQRPLDNVVVYRSLLHILLYPGPAVACLLPAYWRRIRLGLISAADPAKPLGWLVRPCLAQWYRVKRLGQHRHAPAARRGQA